MIEYIMFFLVIAFLTFTVIKLIGTRNKKREAPPIVGNEDIPMCGTYLVTKKDNHTNRVVVYEDCNSVTKRNDFTEEHPEVTKITICARKIIHYYGVDIQKLFDYCAK